MHHYRGSPVSLYYFTEDEKVTKNATENNSPSEVATKSKAALKLKDLFILETLYITKIMKYNLSKCHEVQIATVLNMNVDINKMF